MASRCVVVRIYIRCNVCKPTIGLDVRVESHVYTEMRARRDCHARTDNRTYRHVGLSSPMRILDQIDTTHAGDIISTRTLYRAMSRHGRTYGRRCASAYGCVCTRVCMYSAARGDRCVNTCVHACVCDHVIYPPLIPHLLVRVAIGRRIGRLAMLSLAV